MKLKIIVCVLVMIGFTSLNVNGQKKFRKVLFKKDSCYVYPYRITNYGNYNYYFSNNDFMPCTDSLPDGKFIVYGEFNDYKLRGFIFRKYKVKLDTSRIDVIFNARNGKRNGPCWWYNEKGLLETSGIYKNDAPDGIWVNYTTKGRISSISTYENGLLNGPYVNYWSNGNIYKKGSYKNGEQSGEWNYFFENGNLMSSYSFYPDTIGDPPKDYIIEYSYPFYYSEDYQQLKICGKVYLYHENGKIANISDCSFGYVKVGDTTFYDDGKIEEISKFIGYSEDSLLLYSIEIYNKDGLLESINFYKGENRYKESLFENGVLEKEYYYNNSYDSNDSGELLPSTIYYSSGKISKEIYIFENTASYGDIYFYRNPLENGYVNDFNFTSDFSTGRIAAEKHFLNSDSTYHLIKFYSGNKKDGVEYDSSLLYANGKPFSGEYFFKNKKSQRKQTRFTITDGKLVEMHYTRPWYFHRNRVELSETGTYLNGKENGLFIAKTSRHRILETKTYKNGLLEGEYLSYKMCNVKKGNHKKKFWCIGEKKTYKNGLLEGTLYKYNYDGGVSLVEPYKNGLLNGERLNYSYDYGSKKYYLSKRSNYLNDTLNGLYEKYYASGQIDESGIYKNGEYDGKIYFYNEDGTKYLELNFSEGSLSGDNFEYFKSPANVVKLVATYDAKDSVKTEMYGDKIKEENCLYTAYYKDGTKKAFEGHYGDLFYLKTGKWNYWDNNGTLIKQSDYIPGKFLNLLSEDITDSIHYLGKISEWYSNGNKKTEGFILSEGSEYDCSVEQYISVEDIFYVNFWAEDGTQLVKDKNGKLISNYPDGKIKTQSIILEGLKEGAYKEWDPSGHLSVLGQYINGQKEGRWLSGDLEGIGYVDSECFSSEEDFENAMRASKDDISVTVSYYIKGIWVSGSTFYKNGRRQEWDGGYDVF